MTDNMLAFIEGHKYCVISTVDSTGNPESAFVAFSNDHLNLFIGTSSKSRKFHNLKSNPSVAIVIANEYAEVQYEGQATVVASEDFSNVQEAHFAKVPGSDKYRNDPDQQFVGITPKWIRYIEHGEPDVIEEFTEFK